MNRPFVYTAAAMVTLMSFSKGINFSFIRSYQYSSPAPSGLQSDDNVLIKVAMNGSRTVLNDVWANEDDARWEKFLTD
ncbi:MAG: hypothetical protein ABIY90_04960 [Puia sp.]